MTVQRPIGRPRKAPAERRAERLPAPRVTVAERAFVEDQAARAGLDLAEFCRRAVLRQRIMPRREAADDALIFELNKAGVNLNQIARAVNAGRGVPADLPEAVAEIRAAVAKVLDGGS